MEFHELRNEDTNMAILKDFNEKIKSYKEELLLVLIITFSLSLGFSLGRLSEIQSRKVPIAIETNSIDEVSNVKTSETYENNSTNELVASKNGKKYYFSWCEGAKRISEKNLVSFNTKEEAESLGYEKASNCPGL